MKRLFRFSAVWLALVGVAMTTRAEAQPTSAPDGGSEAHATSSADSEQRAIDIGRTAVELFDAGQFSAALERFAAAEHVAHSPVFVLYMARCSAKLGHWVDARKRLSQVLDEPISEASPVAWQAARSGAAEELSNAAAHVATVAVELLGARGNVALEVDDRNVTPQEAQTLELDPGSHRFSARDSLGHAASTTVEIGGGFSKVTLDLNQGKPATHPPIRKPLTVKQNRGLSIGLMSVGAASMLTGAITGIVVLSRAKDIESRCDGVHCLTSDRPKGERAMTLATISTATLIAGGVASAAGGLLWFLSPNVNVQRNGAAEASLTLTGRF